MNKTVKTFPASGDPYKIEGHTNNTDKLHGFHFVETFDGAWHENYPYMWTKD